MFQERRDVESMIDANRLVMPQERLDVESVINANRQVRGDEAANFEVKIHGLVPDLGIPVHQARRESLHNGWHVVHLSQRGECMRWKFKRKLKKILLSFVNEIEQFNL